MVTGEDDSSNRPFRALCIDGGGMRGIYTAAFLDRLLHQYAIIRGVEALDLGKGFDLISGTSTGAILGCAAAIGRPMSEVVRLYEENGRDIFPHRIKEGFVSPIYRILEGFIGNRFIKQGDKALRRALDEQLRHVTMKDVYERRGISLSIPTVSMESHRPWVFKKTKRSGVRDDNYRLADVCLASSAAPIYRSLAAIKNPDQGTDNYRIFADGGLWANNPVLVALIDALACSEEGCEIEIFSIGTVSRPAGEQIIPKHVHRSMADWQFGAAIGPLAIDAQERAYDDMARFLSAQFTKLGRKVTHVRIPQQRVAATMMQYLSLDESRKRALKALINQGHEDADLVKSLCDRSDHPEGKMIHILLNEIPPMSTAGKDRDDRAFRRLMQQVLAKLDYDDEIQHPTLHGENIVDAGDAKVAFFKDCLEEKLKHLEILDDPDCTHEEAMSAWGKVFNTDWFGDQPDPDAEKKIDNLTTGPFIKKGETRYANDRFA